MYAAGTAKSGLLGDARHFVLEMQVDESDIVKIRPGQLVLVSIGLQPS